MLLMTAKGTGRHRSGRWIGPIGTGLQLIGLDHLVHRIEVIARRLLRMPIPMTALAKAKCIMIAEGRMPMMRRMTMSGMCCMSRLAAHLLSMVQGRGIRHLGLLTPRRSWWTVGQGSAVPRVLLQHTGHVIVHAAQLRQGHAAA